MSLDFEHPERPLIGLNGRFLVAQRTGVQRSAYRLFRSIIERGDRFNFVLFTGESERLAPEWQRPNVRLVTSPLSHRKVLRNHLWEQFTLPRLARQSKVKVLHSPANLAPLLYCGRSIVNIHDLCFFVEPAWFSWSFRLIYSWLVPRIARRSSFVVTNSNHSKNDILQHIGVPLERVRLSYWAVEPLFADHVDPKTVRKDRILFVGSLEPRKNLSGLLQAFNEFRTSHPASRTRLAVVGCENPLFADASYDLGAYAADVEFLGYVSDDVLAQLYRTSRMVVYPSFYEGFGFPPLEAMASGTPVVTSKTSSLPEVVNGAALLIDPHRTHDIAQAIARIHEDQGLAQRLSSLGLQQASKFSWEKTADHMLRLYDELLVPGGSAER
jgi:glycosyltransferase involved in cell wall biosynthesis